MKREELIALGVPDEALDKIMDLNGADIEKEKAKTANAAKEADALKAQLTDVQEKLKAFDGVDVGDLKGQLTKLQEDLSNADTAHKTELAKLARDAETKEFLSGYKFINTETAAHFREKLNAALDDETYKGKNRKDILDSFIVGEDGKPRTDIFVQENKNKLNIPPAGAGADSSTKIQIPKII